MTSDSIFKSDDSTPVKCVCLCFCNQKLLTASSQLRKRCAGCFIGNCTGNALIDNATMIKSGSYEV
jgi:hypothetical protein